MKYRVRTYHYQTPEGAEALVVALVPSTSKEAMILIPGPDVAPLRKLLQRIEEEHPTLCGTDDEAADAPKETLFKGGPPRNPRDN